jgi:ParB family chromosome partitioning protein
MEIKYIPTAKVEVGERLRPVNKAKVAELAKSIADRGQISPIEVVGPNAAGQYELIVGAHRLAACIKADVATVLAVIVDGEMDEIARMMREIDENLYRSELSPYDYAVFISKRAELWEQLHGKIRRGGGKPAIAGSGFTKETADKFGISEDLIERARRRLKLGARNPAMWEALRGTSIAETGVHLDMFLGLPAEKQAALLAAVAEPGVKFTEAYARVHGARPPGSPKTPQQEVAALVKLWSETSEEGQALFRRHIRVKPTRANAEG